MKILRIPFIGIALLSFVKAAVSASKAFPAIQNKAKLTSRTRSHDSKDIMREQEVVLLSPALSVERGGASAPETQAVLGAVIMGILEEFVKKVLKANNIKFPSQLGGCIVLFAGLLLCEIVKPGLGDSIFKGLSPGASLLAKWLPVFFVPGLAMLPLSPSIGPSVEVAKALFVVTLGVCFTLTTVAFSVLSLRAPRQGAVVPPTKSKSALKAKAKSAPAKAFTDETMSFLAGASLVSGAVSIIATKTNNDYAGPLQTLFHLCVTVAGYVWSARLPPSFTKAVHPLVTCSTITLATIHLTGVISGKSFKDVLRTYKVGSLDPMKTGAGDILLYMLGPSVVSFAISMYSRKKLLKENLLVVMTGTLLSGVVSPFATAAFIRAISLGGKTGRVVRLSMISRNVTMALSMAITSILGGDMSIAASIVVLTGIIAGTYARTILDAMGIMDPVSRGFSVGAAGQGLGVASIVSEPDAFPFAAISMVLTAITATVLVSIPAGKRCLTNLALGPAKIPL